MIVILALLITVSVLPVPTESDLVEMGAIVNGEAGGMPYDAQVFVAEQVRLDWYRLDKLDTRWYAYRPDPTGLAAELMRDVFNAPVSQERCGLVGNKFDPGYWKEHGYLDQNAMPDYHWSILDGRFEINAFDCKPYVVIVKRGQKYFGKSVVGPPRVTGGWAWRVRGRKLPNETSTKHCVKSLIGC
ncbi:MAG: hypothetical protein KAJ19_11935 [Gammaproteobacteria bacterium]|nr:hypothetical protein [Gammaproteobacteria bacterium]